MQIASKPRPYVQPSEAASAAMFASSAVVMGSSVRILPARRAAACRGRRLHFERARPQGRKENPLYGLGIARLAEGKRSSGAPLPAGLATFSARKASFPGEKRPSPPAHGSRPMRSAGRVLGDPVGERLGKLPHPFAVRLFDHRPPAMAHASASSGFAFGRGPRQFWSSALLAWIP